jgi:hypothetical protein
MPGTELSTGRRDKAGTREKEDKEEANDLSALGRAITIAPEKKGDYLINSVVTR